MQILIVTYTGLKTPECVKKESKTIQKARLNGLATVVMAAPPQKAGTKTYIEI